MATLAIFAQAAQPNTDDTSGQSKKLTAISNIVPEYPAIAITKKVEGHVTLSFDVNDKGQAVDIEVVNFAGTKHFIRSSVKALEQTRFQSEMMSDVQKRYDFYMVEEEQDNSQTIAFNR